MIRPTSGPNARDLGPGEPLGLIEFAFILIFLSYLVAVMIRHRGLALVLDGLDSHTQGWAFQHIIDPTNHGYFSSPMSSPTRSKTVAASATREGSPISVCRTTARSRR
jgi:hypothetical protein